LTERILNRGGRVLWIAHRSELLVQAAREFQRLTGLARDREKLRGRLIGGGYERMVTMGPDDDVVIASIGVLSRNPELRAELLAYPNLHVVIDEAHHAPAKSYRNLISEYEGAGGRFLLGLTATPTRTIENERPELSRLFGGNVLHQVDLRQLVERGILARPVPVRVKTGANVETGLTDSDRRHLAQFGDLSPEWLTRIAEMDGRNRTIVNHYVGNKKKYAKTIVFALNVEHAETLTREFKTKKVNAEFVASYRPDGSDRSTAEVLENFRDGDCEVLVNVQMVTEGVDVPGVQTVFLARPTGSEILVRQMIGRALRGPEAKGTERAYLVSFDDHWERYRDWQSPLDLVPDITDLADGQDLEVSVEPAGQTDVVDRQPHVSIEDMPHDVVHAVLTRLRQLRPDQKVEVFEAVPLGQYILEREEGEESIRRVVSVFEHQKPFWDELLTGLRATSQKDLEDAVGSERWDAIFADCDAPAPPQDEIDAVVRHFAVGADAPEYHPMEAREKYDPRRLAAEIKAKDLGATAQRQLVETRYGGFARAVYPTVKDFYDAVHVALSDLMYDGDNRAPATVNFEPLPTRRLKDDAPHDLSKLLERTLKTGSSLLSLPSLPPSEPPTWSRRPVKSWWGIADWHKNTIRINRLMNSSDVSAEAVCFVLWHEYLHLFLKQLHTGEFRALEKKWPGWKECDREIERLKDRFDIWYW
jgi:superfamily II DNA or RNA helicase